MKNPPAAASSSPAETGKASASRPIPRIVRIFSDTALAPLSPAGPGFQTPFATAIRNQVGIATGTVGMITEPTQAEQIVATEQADAVFLARELLRDPHWPMRAAQALQAEHKWPVQYERAKP